MQTTDKNFFLHVVVSYGINGSCEYMYYNSIKVVYCSKFRTIMNEALGVTKLIQNCKNYYNASKTDKMTISLIIILL